MAEHDEQHRIRRQIDRLGPAEAVQLRRLLAALDPHAVARIERRTADVLEQIDDTLTAVTVAARTPITAST